MFDLRLHGLQGYGKAICILTMESGVTESTVFKPRKYGRKCGHSRSIDKTARTAVYQDIIDKGGRKSAKDRAQKRGPDPVLTTIIEFCIMNVLVTLTERLGGSSWPYLAVRNRPSRP
jgi:hypothetical protein